MSQKLFFGNNGGQKPVNAMSKGNNQAFIFISPKRRHRCIRVVAAKLQILVTEQEEYQISKTDMTAENPIPIYGVSDREADLSGISSATEFYH